MKIELSHFRDKLERAIQTYHYNRKKGKGRVASFRWFLQVLCLYFLDIRFIPRDLKKRLKIWRSQTGHRRPY